MTLLLLCVLSAHCMHTEWSTASGQLMAVCIRAAQLMPACTLAVWVPVSWCCICSCYNNTPHCQVAETGSICVPHIISHDSCTAGSHSGCSVQHPIGSVPRRRFDASTTMQRKVYGKPQLSTLTTIKYYWQWFRYRQCDRVHDAAVDDHRVVLVTPTRPGATSALPMTFAFRKQLHTGTDDALQTSSTIPTVPVYGRGQATHRRGAYSSALSATATTGSGLHAA